MNEKELILLEELKQACAKNPKLFSSAVLYMQAGIEDAIQKYKQHALQMEKLAVGFSALENKRMTPSMREHAEKMVAAVRDTTIFFDLRGE